MWKIYLFEVFQFAIFKSANNYLKQAFKIDSNWQVAALDDKDLQLLWSDV